MRFTVAVLGAGFVQIFPYLRLDQWVGAGALLAIAYIAFAAFGAGLFAGRRTALAGALSVLLGAFLYVLVAGLTQPGGDPGAIASFFLRIPIAVFPFILVGAFAGWLGGAARARTVGARP
ncbi:MAG: hypothetical protein M3T56_14025 [Chloroflexota bacterium]|nr:hypothetical protein [Chloroflexota bacterium]